MEDLLVKNRLWAAGMTAKDPMFFKRLAEQQSPKILWIGCSDSRVPASEIIGLMPGEVFVHRNIANMVIHTDLNCLSVIQYAVQILEVEDIIICGHYGCGGIKSALESQSHGLIDNWLGHVKDIYRFHENTIKRLNSDQEKQARMCELNVIEQVHNVCRTTIIQYAWQAKKKLSVHGWIYDVKDGLIQDLDVTIERVEQLPAHHQIKL
ncbi:MAG: carbonate dehydratase [Mariprofundaceae bacterium]|nr:carbonate dehydratase [Mariprofundaceae bacterium]